VTAPAGHWKLTPRHPHQPNRAHQHPRTAWAILGLAHRSGRNRAEISLHRIEGRHCTKQVAQSRMNIPSRSRTQPLSAASPTRRSRSEASSSSAISSLIPPWPSTARPLRAPEPRLVPVPGSVCLRRDMRLLLRPILHGHRSSRSGRTEPRGSDHWSSSARPGSPRSSVEPASGTDPMKDVDAIATGTARAPRAPIHPGAVPTPRRQRDRLLEHDPHPARPRRASHTSPRPRSSPASHQPCSSHVNPLGFH
jgi:hypothetical protein